MDCPRAEAVVVFRLVTSAGHLHMPFRKPSAHSRGKGSRRSRYLLPQPPDIGLACHCLHYFRHQVEAVIAVAGKAARPGPQLHCLPVCRCVPVFSRIKFLFFLQVKMIVEVRPRDSGRVVQEHPDGDLPAPFVRHPPVRQVSAHRFVQGYPSLLHQLHDSRRHIDFGDRAYII